MTAVTGVTGVTGPGRSGEWVDVAMDGGVATVLRAPGSGARMSGSGPSRVSGSGPSGSGPSVVLIHGAGGNASTWVPTLAAWSGLDLWCPSLPGRGHGCPVATVGEAAAWLGSFLAAAGLVRPIVVGHSFGGAIALELALDQPDALAAVVMVSSGARLRVAPAILEAAAAATPKHPLSTRFAFGPATDDGLIRAYDRLAARTPPEAALADWRACDGFDRLTSLAALRCRALVVYGDADVLTPSKYQRLLVNALPDADCVEVSGAGHMLPWERPGALAAAVRAEARRSAGDSIPTTPLAISP